MTDYLADVAILFLALGYNNFFDWVWLVMGSGAVEGLNTDCPFYSSMMVERLARTSSRCRRARL